MELFPAQYYQTVFLILTFVLTLSQSIVLARQNGNSILYKNHNSDAISLFLVMFILVVGLRPIRGFGDTFLYAHLFGLYHDKAAYMLDGGGEWIFNNFMWYCSQVMSVHIFFLIIEILYVVPVIIACKRLCPKNVAVMMLFFVGAYSFFSYGTNGIRHGMACSLVILALSYIEGDKFAKIKCAVLCFIAVNCHRSTALPIVAMLFVYFYRKPKAMFYFWISSIAISYTIGGLLESLLTMLGFDDRMALYIGGQDSDDVMRQFTQKGFRWDFLLYSSMPIWLGWYLIFKKKVYNSTYIILLGTYIYSNAFWVMVIRAAFSNRFAYLSWFLYPIVLAYPLLTLKIWPDQGKKTSQIMLAHIGFTIFMWMIGK